jgi:hypothetical protein
MPAIPQSMMVAKPRSVAMRLNDAVAIKQINANTLTDERKKAGGPYKASGRTVISNGGKTMTTTTIGTNASGKEFTSAFVFARQ